MRVSSEHILTVMLVWQVRVRSFPCYPIRFNEVVAWGFLASKEVKEAGVGNLGPQDRKLSYIFGYGNTLTCA